MLNISDINKSRESSH